MSAFPFWCVLISWCSSNKRTRGIEMRWKKEGSASLLYIVYNLPGHARNQGSRGHFKEWRYGDPKSDLIVPWSGSNQSSTGSVPLESKESKQITWKLKLKFEEQQSRRSSWTLCSGGDCWLVGSSSGGSANQRGVFNQVSFYTQHSQYTTTTTIVGNQYLMVLL